MEISKKESLLLLTKEELAHKLFKSQREVSLQHDLLKQTFLENKSLQEKCDQLELKLSESLGEGYSGSLSWVSKIVFVLKKEDRPLRSIDLISILETKEPTLQNHHSKAKFFSAFLNTAVKYNRIVQQKIKGVRGYYYLLPEWVDSEGNVKHSYKEMMV